MSGVDPDTTPDSGEPGTLGRGCQSADRDPPLRWRRAPERPATSPGHVHVWQIDLDSDAQPTDNLEALLCDEERARAARFVHAHHRRRFAVRRAALRTILGRYLNTEPGALRFVVGPHGKPALAGAASSSGIRFNVSHSDRLALIAVAHSREVGIDIERIRPDVHLHDIARRFLGPAAAQALLALPPKDQPPAFMRCWCSKEACVKALGVGLAAGQDVLEAAMLPDSLLAALRAPGWTVESDRWSVSALEIDTGFVAVLAVEGRDYTLAAFRYQTPGVPEGD
jgi:4'-phosphopantetheinyl transferase